MSDRSRCGICGRSRPTEQTALVNGRRAGNFWRSVSVTRRRVCVDCTRERVESVRSAQGEGRNVSLDDAFVRWSQAAAALDVDTAGVRRT